MANKEGFSGPRYKKVNGFTIPEAFSTEAFLDGLQYKPRDDDIFIVTFPKGGTTWTQNIVQLILRKGNPFKDVNEFKASSPFLEAYGSEALNHMPRPGTIKTHLPYDLMPYSPKAKYIYVARNPKDTCVSFYHFTRESGTFDFDGFFSDFFGIFYRGENNFGDYFSHTLSWYNHRQDENVYFTTYEEMKMDTRESILGFAKFLGAGYVKMLKDEPIVMENILKYSSLEEMKKVMNAKPINNSSQSETLPSGLKYLLEKKAEMKIKRSSDFEMVRKGIIGDWRNYFSEEESRMLDDKTREKLAGTYLVPLWQKLEILK